MSDQRRFFFPFWWYIALLGITQVFGYFSPAIFNAVVGGGHHFSLGQANDVRELWWLSSYALIGYYAVACYVFERLSNFLHRNDQT
jgi:hypothetical protein